VRHVLVVIMAATLAACQSMPPDQAQSEISRATAAWAEGMSRHDIDAVMALYDSDAVLWGTRSAQLRDNPERVREYFGVLRTVPASYKAVVGEQRIRVYGDIAIDTGTYTFSEVRDGKEVLRPARFSMVYHRRDGRWLIVDHHSSALPVQ